MTLSARTCRRCGGSMLPGIAIQQTMICGSRDLGECVTLSPGGPGRLTECMKCPRCGYSVKETGCCDSWGRRCAPVLDLRCARISASDTNSGLLYASTVLHYLPIWHIVEPCSHRLHRASGTQGQETKMSKTYRISSKAGVVFGDYEGETPEEAFAAMVADGVAGDDADGHSTAGTAGDWIIEEVAAE